MGRALKNKTRTSSAILAMIVPAKERRNLLEILAAMRAFAQPAEELYSNAE